MTEKILLPSILLFMAFVLKLVVDQKAELPDLIRAVLALPVDIVFLATSLVVGFTIASPQRLNQGIPLFTGYLLVAVVHVLLWRRSERLFLADNFRWTIILSLVNYILCSIGLFYAVQLVSSTGKV